MSSETEFHEQLRRAAESGTLDEEMRHAEKGVKIQTLDAMITVAEMSHLVADIWQEDESDIMLHVLPPPPEAAFDAYEEVVRPQLEACVARVIGMDHDVICDEFGWRHGDRTVSRKTDVKATGMDLIQLRIIRLFKRPMAAHKVVECLRLFNSVLAGKHAPVEMPQPSVHLTGT